MCVCVLVCMLNSSPKSVAVYLFTVMSVLCPLPSGVVVVICIQENNLIITLNSSGHGHNALTQKPNLNMFGHYFGCHFALLVTIFESTKDTTNE